MKAWKGDTEGNLVYRKTARNHNPAIATAGKITIAEVRWHRRLASRGIKPISKKRVRHCSCEIDLSLCSFQVEELVPAGAIDPDDVHTPGIYVDRVVQARYRSRCFKVVIFEHVVDSLHAQQQLLR